MFLPISILPPPSVAAAGRVSVTDAVPVGTGVIGVPLGTGGEPPEMLAPSPSRNGRSAASAAEPAWPLPLERRYRRQLDSDVADLTNMGGAHAGAITAALFLDEFTVGTRTWPAEMSPQRSAHG